MSILIGADIVPTSSNIDLFKSGDADALLGGELINVLDRADYRIFNLETPLSDTETPIMKHGSNHIAPTICTVGLKAMGVDLLTLANNHILDQGETGLKSTFRALDDAGIAYLGAGDIAKAREPYILETAGKKVAVYACTEHEFSLCAPDRIGANPYDPLYSFDHISQIKADADYVIVLYHGGKELYRYPSPALQKTCRRFIDKGADLVICQHSHCIGCEERYAGGIVVYGQGNFLFDDDDSEFGKTGLLIKIDDDLKISYIPIVKHESVVRLAAGTEAGEILTEFETRSKEALSEEFLKIKYEKLAEYFLRYYLQVAGGRRSKFFAFLDRLSHGRLNLFRIRRKYGPDEMIALKNIIECEVHNELFICGLDKGYKRD